MLLCMIGLAALAQDIVLDENLTASTVDASPAVVESSRPSAKARIVAEAWVSVTTDNPHALSDRIVARASQVGAVVVRQEREHGWDGAAEALVELHVPEAAYARAADTLLGGLDSSLDLQRLPIQDVVGNGAPVVSMIVEIAGVPVVEPMFLVGAAGGVSLPLTDSGPGLSGSAGLRIMEDRSTSFEALYGPALGDEPWMLTLTAGGATYSDYLGGGERVVLNPFLGGRLGYQYRGHSFFVLQAELGVELLSVGHVIWDVHVRPTGHFRQGEVGLSVEGGTGLVLPF